MYSVDYQAPDHTVTELKSPPCEYYVEIVGSFNGIVLLQMDNAELCLWNPSAKTYQKFSPPEGENGSLKYGLCHDSVSDDFKVVSVSSRLSDSRSAVHMFTSKLSSSSELCRGRKDGEVVMKLDSEKLVIYNPKQNIYKRIEIPLDCKWSDAAYYMESLVSPRVCNGTS
ncbi:hypothetical protein RHSIM_Rhsim04G0211200 [Rhododendron simsii]|uniref:F-box associated beta-propeller type 3 domain-containing protein n=1 Tax=Rhododendron simsii TaxID=118357 RepID=A0A834H865_RHOSS|nr:hypothetical protein RHSIM_Rhsim04G0211200 [Rhododendron simsii]